MENIDRQKIIAEINRRENQKRIIENFSRLTGHNQDKGVGTIIDTSNNKITPVGSFNPNNLPEVNVKKNNNYFVPAKTSDMDGGIEEIKDGTIDTTPEVLPSIPNVPTEIGNQPLQETPVQQPIQPQVQYQTPREKQDYLDSIQQFAMAYPQLQEADRRRRMQAALLSPVIKNDEFVRNATSPGLLETQAKQLELLNTAANARVSEAQKPMLAAAFAQAGMPAELAYASEEQLKSLVNLLVAKTNMESGMYKANLAAQTGMYKANTQLEGVRIATAAKQGPEKLIQVLGQAGYSTNEIDEMLKNVYGTQWKSMIGTGAPIQFNISTGQTSGPEERNFYQD